MNNANLSSLRERVEIYQKQRQVTSHGYVSYVYAPTRTAWASVVGYTATFTEGKVEDTREIRYRVIMRYENREIGVKDRIKYRGRMLEVTTEPVDVDGRKKYIYVNAREWVEDEKK